MAVIKISDIIDESSILDFVKITKELELLQENITSLKSFKVKVQGIKVCEYCNTKITSNKVNCINCGAPV
jgi:hypothetical protein